MQQNLKIMQGWVGSNIDSCVMKWGQPTKTFRLQSGNMLYTWRESHGSTSTTSRELFSWDVKTETTHKYCDWTLLVSPNGTILQGRLEGNDCG